MYQTYACNLCSVLLKSYSLHKFIDGGLYTSTSGDIFVCGKATYKLQKP